MVGRWLVGLVVVAGCGGKATAPVVTSETPVTGETAPVVAWAEDDRTTELYGGDAYGGDRYGGHYGMYDGDMDMFGMAGEASLDDRNDMRRRGYTNRGEPSLQDTCDEVDQQVATVLACAGLTADVKTSLTSMISMYRTSSGQGTCRMLVEMLSQQLRMANC